MIWVTKFIERHLKEKEERKLALEKKVAEAEAEQGRLEKEYLKKHFKIVGRAGESPYRGSQVGLEPPIGFSGFGPIRFSGSLDGYKRKPTFGEIQDRIKEEYRDGEEMMAKIKTNKPKRYRKPKPLTEMEEWVKQARVEE